MSKSKDDALYFVFYRGEDEPWQFVMTQEELVGELNDPEGSFSRIEFGRTVCKHDSWPDNYGYIIKGEVVQPEAERVVTKLKVK